jgi:hypothetical protein
MGDGRWPCCADERHFRGTVPQGQLGHTGRGSAALARALRGGFVPLLP